MNKRQGFFSISKRDWFWIVATIVFVACQTWDTLPLYGIAIGILILLLIPLILLVVLFLTGVLSRITGSIKIAWRKKTTQWPAPVSNDDFLCGCGIDPDSPEAVVALELRRFLAVDIARHTKLTPEDIAPDMTCGELCFDVDWHVYHNDGIDSMVIEAGRKLGKGRVPEEAFDRFIQPEKKSRATMRELFLNYLDVFMPYLAAAGETTGNDIVFLAGCGVKADTDEARLALAIRTTLAEQYHVPYENVVPELQWGKLKPLKKVWSIVDYWLYQESIMAKFRRFDLRREDSLLFSLPYEGIDEKITVRDFVTSLIEIFNRYEHAVDYLPNQEAAKVSVDMETVLEQLKSRYVLLQGGTSDARHEMVAEVVRTLDTEYTICHFPDGLKTKQDFWDAMHSFVPMGPRYEVDGQSSLDMEADYFERRSVIDQRPDKLLFIWENVSPDTLSEMLAFIVEDYYEMAWLQKPEKLRYLVTLQQPIQKLPKLKLTYSGDSPNSYCPDSVDSDDLTRRVIAICDLTGGMEAGR